MLVVFILIVFVNVQFYVLD